MGFLLYRSNSGRCSPSDLLQRQSFDLQHLDYLALAEGERSQQRLQIAALSGRLCCFHRFLFQFLLVESGAHGSSVVIHAHVTRYCGGVAEVIASPIINPSSSEMS